MVRYWRLALLAAISAPAPGAAQEHRKPLAQLAECASPEARSELARTGTFRLGFTNVPLWAVRELGTSRLQGIAVELGESLAGQLGVGFAPVTAPNLPKLIEIGRADEWDALVSVVSPEKGDTLESSAPVMLDEATLMVPANSSIRSLADADRPGVRIAVVRNNPTEVFLTSNVKKAALVRAENEQASVDLVRSGAADIMALARWNVPRRLVVLPGFRSLDENFAAQPVAISVLKGRKAAEACLAAFANLARTELMPDAIRRSGLIGITIPRNP